jgi:MinD superfamily P-loop ATPase
VIEPTVAGVHDMHRVLETADHFNIQTLVCINKADIYPAGTDGILTFCQEQGIPVVGKIPYDLTVTEAMVQGQPVTLNAPDSPSSQALRRVWEEVAAILQNEGIR